MLESLAQITNPVLEGPLGSDPEGAQATASLLATVVRLLVIVGGVLMLLYLLVAGLNWITAEGKPEKLEKARNQIIQAVTGMIILAAVIAVVSLIGAVLGLNILDIDIPKVSEL